jgi:hypothetical protein
MREGLLDGANIGSKEHHQSPQDQVPDESESTLLEPLMLENENRVSTRRYEKAAPSTDLHVADGPPAPMAISIWACRKKILKDFL